MELEVRPAQPGTLGYWLKSLSIQLFALVVADVGGKGKIDETDAPAVLVISSSGEEHVLQHTGTCRQAQAACRRLQAERRKLGDVEFCRVHGLPDRYAQASDSRNSGAGNQPTGGCQ